ncbi:MAG: sigma-70 family RNA polymerase sigma factor [Fimbriimonadales bacterium]
MRKGLSREDCADTFQNTFLQFHRNLDRIESALAVPKWLAVTASREALRILRTNPKRASLDDPEEQGLDELVALEDRSAEVSAIESVRADLLRESVRAVGGKCSKLLWVLFFEDFESYEEVGTKLGMPVGAIGPTRSRCLAKLRELLKREDFFDEDC